MIDGRKINQEIGEQLKREIESRNLSLSLGILCVGSDPASISFINVKKRFGEKYGFIVNLYHLSEQLEKKEIKKEVMNIQNSNTAIIIQLPLPEKFKRDTDEILSWIEFKKDVDNLTGKNLYESPIILSLKKVLPEKIGKIGIVGMGKVVGLPVREFCIENNIVFEEINKNEYEKIGSCDVVISAVGTPYLINKENLNVNSTLIDYGCSYVNGKACGDFDPGCYEIAKEYTPVPGGMGPIVVACLFQNVLKSLNKKYE